MKVYWCFLLMNPLFNHVSSEIFLSWVLASSEGGTDVLIQFLYLKKEKKSERTEYIQWSTELSSRIMLELGKKKKKKAMFLKSLVDGLFTLLYVTIISCWVQGKLASSQPPQNKNQHDAIFLLYQDVIVSSASCLVLG